MDDVRIEICLEGVDSVLAAEEGGADRVELCSDLFEGGLSPSIGTVRTALRLSHIPINAMVRPRGGDFCYSEAEFEVMKEEVKAFKAEGVNAIVFGILTPDGRVDKERSRQLIELARPLEVTFHRAFDMTMDLDEALEDLIALGVDRVLTSGGEESVCEGAEMLRHLVRNFNRLSSYIGAKEYHLMLNCEKPSVMEYHPQHIYMGGLLRQSEFSIPMTSAQRVGTITGRP